MRLSVGVGEARRSARRCLGCVVMIRCSDSDERIRLPCLKSGERVVAEQRYTTTELRLNCCANSGELLPSKLLRFGHSERIDDTDVVDDGECRFGRRHRADVETPIRVTRLLDPIVDGTVLPSDVELLMLIRRHE